MKNGREVRPNGAVITKIDGKKIPLYYVAGSPNGPWDALRNARKDADAMREFDGQVQFDSIACDGHMEHVRVLAHSTHWASEMINEGRAKILEGRTDRVPHYLTTDKDFCEVPK